MGLVKKATLLDELKALLQVESELKANEGLPEKTLQQTELVSGLFEQDCINHISNQVLEKVLALAKHSRDACQIKGTEQSNGAVIWEVHEVHHQVNIARKKRQRLIIHTRHHVIFPVWCSCNRQVTSGMPCIHMVHVALITKQKLPLSSFNQRFTVPVPTEVSQCSWL